MSNPPSAAILATCPWIPGFRSDDLGEVRRFFGEFNGARARVAHSRQPMGCVAHALKGRITALGSTASRVGQTAWWAVEGPVFQLAMPAGSVFRTGRQVSVPTGPSSVVIVPSGWEWTRISPPGLLFAVHVDHRALRDEVQALRPSSKGELVSDLVVRDIDAATRARLRAAVADTVLASRPGAPAQQLKLAEARLLAETAQLMPDVPRRQRPADLSQQRVLDLEGWIDAHLGEAITLGELCRIAGVGERCLQRDFERRRGMSPMRFVAERRLAAAHQALLRAHPGASVTQIALANGFEHVGRFAELYRHIIGELPSRTLARSRRH
jgi:AraC-like DNA-binding protein